MTKDFVIVLLFDENLDRLLLVKRTKKPFAGCCNGPGGEVEPGETPLQAAQRELYEETNLVDDDLLPASTGPHLKWVGTLAIPYNRKYPETTGDETSPPASIYYYTGRIKPNAAPRTMEARNEVVKYPVCDILGTSPDRPKLAGHGNLEYFIREAIIILTDPASDMQ